MINQKNFFSYSLPQKNNLIRDVNYDNTPFYIAVFIFFLLLFCLFCQQLFNPTIYMSDLSSHVDMGLSGEIYSLSGFVTSLTAWMPKNLIYITNAALLAGANAVTAIFLRRFALKLLNRQHSNFTIDVAIICVLVASAIFFPSFETYYINAGSPNVWHNSTSIVNRLFAIFTLEVYFETLLKYQQYKNGFLNRSKVVRQYVLLCVVVFICMFAKPSFFMGFMPACVILLAVELIKTKGGSFFPSLWVGVSFIPSLFVLVFQRIFVENEVSAEIAIIPFDFILTVNSSILYFVFRLTLNCLFVLFVFFATIKQQGFIERTIYLATVIGLLLFILFTEVGLSSGNFLWTYSINLFFSFFIATCRLLKEDTGRKTRYIGFFILSIHVVCGAIYLSKILLGGSYG